MRSNKTSPLLSVVVSLVIFASPAAFAAATWNFSDTTTGNPDGCQAQGSGFGQQAANSNNFGNTYKCAATTGTGPTVTVSAWGGVNSTGSNGFQAALVSAQLGSGFGLKSQYEGLGATSPQHSMDNDPTNSATPDLFLLSFSSAVALDQVVLGWTTSDSDFTVMAYTGAQAPSAFLQGKNATTLTSGGAAAGWELIENSGDADQSSAASMSNIRTVNAGTDPVTSSWWLISAYNVGYGGGALDTRKDYMKILSVSTKDVPTTKVAEPGSLALMGIALAAVVGMRRRRGKVA